MKRIWNMFKEIPQEVNLSKSEFLLTVAVASLIGIVVGMMISPRKNQEFGCNNGNTFIDADEYDECEEFEE